MLLRYNDEVRVIEGKWKGLKGIVKVVRMEGKGFRVKIKIDERNVIYVDLESIENWSEYQFFEIKLLSSEG